MRQLDFSNVLRRLPGVTDYEQPRNRAARAEQKFMDSLKDKPGFKEWRALLEFGDLEALAIYDMAKRLYWRRNEEPPEPWLWHRGVPVA